MSLYTTDPLSLFRLLSSSSTSSNQMGSKVAKGDCKFKKKKKKLSHSVMLLFALLVIYTTFSFSTLKAP